FAYMTVAEISISSYLDLISENDVVQPMNRATVRLHNRDERCHASIADEIAGIVFETLDADSRGCFLEGIVDAMNAFASNDYSMWRTIIDFENVTGGQSMIDDVENETGRSRLVQDFSGIRKLCQHIGITDRVEFDWD
ncbi:MAG: diiron oxygenase, partial [Rhodococcus sp. (in: high G+C Gram-positive bacteria)]|uniref:diiron oxygenase n=1 Tax=Rhodococcus sp. TaxID=1831 RepID=UPI003BAFFA62